MWPRSAFRGSAPCSGALSGGLFATWTLPTRPACFSRYVIVSPALWWDGETAFGIEEERAEGRDDLRARVYIAAGEGEEGHGIPGLDRWKLVTNARRMAGILEGRRYATLSVSFEVLPRESHTSAAAVGLTRGPRAVFDEPGTPGPWHPHFLPTALRAGNRGRFCGSWPKLLPRPIRPSAPWEEMSP